MLFNSLAFLIFLPLVFVTYWYLLGRVLRWQNAFVLAASYFFYGWWDWRFLGLLIFSSCVDLFLGLAIERATKRRKRRTWLALSVITNLTLLGFFKYFDFFIGGFHDLLEALGFNAHMPTLRVILPVGISFYTFQSMSYIIDVYRGQVKARRDPLVFLAFVGFFPQLVAGPIERARDLLPQFERPRQFDPEGAKDGLRRMLWGFFKKIVIADNCADLADRIFALDASSTPGITLFFGAFFFAFQIYGDFSGYSDIAIGCARLFGFTLSRNFNYPYFSRSIPEFWRRWHISLSTWFRDYLYIPLGGWTTRWGRWRNILITFTVSGLWHGANWTFMGWGALHGAYFLPEVVGNKRARRDLPMLRDLPRILWTFFLVTLAWIFFRAATVHGALLHVVHVFINAGEHPGAVLLWLLSPQFLLIALLVGIEWSTRRGSHALERLPRSVFMRWGLYAMITFAILLNIDLHAPHAFIYFQF